MALRHEPLTAIMNNGSLAIRSGEKTGRSPDDKHIVQEPSSEKLVWWGDVNRPIDDRTFEINLHRASDYLDTRERLFITDGYAGWDPATRLKVRIVCSRAYHALFMRNMLIRPTESELENFGKPDFVVLNAGEFPANPLTEHVTSRTSVDINFAKKTMVILGTEYAGEMKKGVFTLMNFLMPNQNILSMHCSANEGKDGDVSLFFGLSGTGKTTLSADTNRLLIGDDEHCWSDTGVFNIEGGCYAKCIGLSREKEPEIFDAVRFGSVVENVTYNEQSREINYDDSSLTQNTRVSYPLEYIPNAKIPAVGGHPKNIILLTCDAFGVLPPVSQLTPEQLMYHFLSGYTAKVAGTEQGVKEPKATFSACFGAAFMVHHPMTYAKLLAERMKAHAAKAWLVNTGWIGGAYGEGERISLKHTRSIIDAIHSGTLDECEKIADPHFKLAVPKAVENVPSDVLTPWTFWKDAASYKGKATELASLFHKNFEQYESEADAAVISSGPGK